MRAARVDWRMNACGGAEHSFTHPLTDANHKTLPGINYHQLSAERSWRAMIDIFDEVFRDRAERMTPSSAFQGLRSNRKRVTGAYRARTDPLDPSDARSAWIRAPWSPSDRHHRPKSPRLGLLPGRRWWWARLPDRTSIWDRSAVPVACRSKVPAPRRRASIPRRGWPRLGTLLPRRWGSEMLALRKMTTEDLGPVARWLKTAHVAKWYVTGSTEDELEDIRQSVAGEQPTHMLVVEEDGRPIG
jgi:Acetyltransferase (GNAT) domain